jgi:DnaK suppressor protein
MDKVHASFPGGKYMNTHQLEWFRKELQRQLDECERLIADARTQDDQAAPEGDEADVADYKIQVEQQASAIHRLHIQTHALETALSRIDSGDYGYCDETGDEIGLPRLKANPTARLSLDAQERMERQKRLQGAG